MSTGLISDSSRKWITGAVIVAGIAVFISIALQLLKTTHPFAAFMQACVLSLCSAALVTIIYHVVRRPLFTFVSQEAKRVLLFGILAGVLLAQLVVIRDAPGLGLTSYFQQVYTWVICLCASVFGLIALHAVGMHIMRGPTYSRPKRAKLP